MAETMQENGPLPSTVVVQESEGPNPAVPAVRLKLKKPKADKKVAWTPDTVDNENMNKKKSKCCCIYEKPREFDESSSDTDDECANCKGHVEHKPRKPPVAPDVDLPSDQGDAN